MMAGGTWGGSRMLGRRDFITLIGGAGLLCAVKARRARAQQPAMPVIGFLHPDSPDGYYDRVRGFRAGLKQAGYVEGENVAIDYRWAESQLDKLPALAAELVRRRVAVIAAGSTITAQVAKAATTTIPVVFLVAEDPVRLGLVSSLARPAGNMTGINFFVAEVSAKRLELLRILRPAAARVAVLVNPANAPTTGTTLRDLETAARAMGLALAIFNASSSREIDEAYAALARERPDAVFISLDPIFVGRRVQLAHLATRHGLPAIYPGREFVEAGGLMSYGTSLADAFHQVGLFTGRTPKGAKPADLPVVQANTFEFVINLQTARTLGIEVPPDLLSIADEVIE